MTIRKPCFLLTGKAPVPLQTIRRSFHQPPVPPAAGGMVHNQSLLRYRRAGLDVKAPIHSRNPQGSRGTECDSPGIASCPTSNRVHCDARRHVGKRFELSTGVSQWRTHSGHGSNRANKIAPQKRDESFARQTNPCTTKPGRAFPGENNRITHWAASSRLTSGLAERHRRGIAAPGMKRFCSLSS